MNNAIQNKINFFFFNWADSNDTFNGFANFCQGQEARTIQDLQGPGIEGLALEIAKEIPGVGSENAGEVLAFLEENKKDLVCALLG